MTTRPPQSPATLRSARTIRHRTGRLLLPTLLVPALLLAALAASGRLAWAAAHLLSLLPAARLTLGEGARAAVLNGAAFAFTMALVMFFAMLERVRIALPPADAPGQAQDGAA